MEDLDPEEMRPVVDPGQPRGKLERYQQVFSGAVNCSLAPSPPRRQSAQTTSS